MLKWSYSIKLWYNILLNNSCFGNKIINIIVMIHINKYRIFTNALYLSLCLVKALRLPATPPCNSYAVIEGVQIVAPRMMLPISNLTTCKYRTI